MSARSTRAAGCASFANAVTPIVFMAALGAMIIAGFGLTAVAAPILKSASAANQFSRRHCSPSRCITEKNGHPSRCTRHSSPPAGRRCCRLSLRGQTSCALPLASPLLCFWRKPSVCQRRPPPKNHRPNPLLKRLPNHPRKRKFLLRSLTTIPSCLWPMAMNLPGPCDSA